jgi:hypothetical protein
MSEMMMRRASGACEVMSRQKALNMSSDNEKSRSPAAHPFLKE